MNGVELSIDITTIIIFVLLLVAIVVAALVALSFFGGLPRKAKELFDKIFYPKDKSGMIIKIAIALGVVALAVASLLFSPLSIIGYAIVGIIGLVASSISTYEIYRFFGSNGSIKEYEQGRIYPISELEKLGAKIEKQKKEGAKYWSYTIDKDGKVAIDFYKNKLETSYFSTVWEISK